MKIFRNFIKFHILELMEKYYLKLLYHSNKNRNLLWFFYIEWFKVRDGCCVVDIGGTVDLATGWWFSPGPLVSSTNKADCHDITEIVLKVTLNTIKQKTKLDSVVFNSGS
jgi:hypothetical protein